MCNDIEGGGGGGVGIVIDSNEGDHFNEITFKGGISKISPCLAQKPPLTPGDK